MNKKQGISLIVLVITIIVMVILAASVVITLSNTGIINKANQAVSMTNVKQIEQLASLAWSEAFMEGARTQEELQTAINNALKDVDTTGVTVTVTTAGVIVKPIDDNNSSIEMYILGASKAGKLATDIIDTSNYTFIDDAATLENESDTITLYVDSITQNTEQMELYVYISHNNVDYELTIDMNTGYTKSLEQTNLVNILENYIFDSEGNGKNINDVFEFPYFINNSESIPNAKYTILLFGVSTEEDEQIQKLDIRYYNKAYELSYDKDTSIIQKLELIYTPNGKEGKTVKYDSDNDGTPEEWVVLTDRDNKLEIISKSVMYDSDGVGLTLGKEDEYVKVTTDLDGNGVVGNIEDIAIASYNNAVTTINGFCKSIIKTSDYDEVRSVIGADYSNGNYTSSVFNSWYNGENVKAEDNALTADYNGDLFKMSFWGIDSVGNEYWITSRAVTDQSQEDFKRFNFSVRYIFRSLYMCRDYAYPLWRLYENRIETDGATYGVRPIIVNPKGIK